MKQVTIRLSHELFAALDQAAEQVGRTRAAVARVAIDQFIETFGSQEGKSATGKPQEGRRNPYARTRPTPLQDRERNHLLRQLRDAQLKERELLARLDGASREIGGLPTPTVGDSPVEDSCVARAEGVTPEGDAPDGGLSGGASGAEEFVPKLPALRRRAPKGTRRWMLEAFGPVDPPGPEVQTIEEYREWFRASFLESS